MARKAKRSRARTAQLRQRRVARRRDRQRRIEAQADLKPLGEKSETESRRRKRHGAQQRRHDRRRRRGQANRDPGAAYPNSPSTQIFGMRPAGGQGQRHPSGSKLFVGIVGPSTGQVMRSEDKPPPKRRQGRSGSEKRRHKKGGRYRGPGGPGNRAAGKRPALEVFAGPELEKPKR
ncbi:MAG TPA: hypothetical protein VGK41_05520 [Solirubrobacterales bacterium]